MSGMTKHRLPRAAARSGTVGLVLAVAALVVPDSAVKSTEVALVKIHSAGGVDLSPDVVWILAVGSDARPGEDMTRTRGDALQLVGMNTKTGAATAIGIPRDSWVSIPGYGSERINASLYFGGPQLLGQTVGNLVGIQPDYVFVTRFPFFEAMIGAIGGIDGRTTRSRSATSTSSRRASRRAGSTSAAYDAHGVLPDPPQPDRRRLRPLGQPAAGAARHPGQGPRPGARPRASSSAACCR